MPPAVETIARGQPSRVLGNDISHFGFWLCALSHGILRHLWKRMLELNGVALPERPIYALSGLRLDPVAPMLSTGSLIITWP